MRNAIRTVRAACLVLVAAGILMLTPTGAWAAGSPEDLITGLNGPRIEAIFRGLGIECEEIEESVYLINLEGYRVVLFNMGVSLQLYAGFEDQVDLATINEWNRNVRYSRAYVDDDGTAVIESDLDLDSGVTMDGIVEYIDTFRVSVQAFANLLMQASAPQGEARGGNAPTMGGGRRIEISTGAPALTRAALDEWI